MPTFNDLYGSKFLSAADLGNREIRATISDVAAEELTDRETNKTKTKLVVGFRGKTKKLILNKINATALKNGLGSDEWTSWVGTDVVLFTQETTMGPGVRLRVSAAVEMSDEIPF